MMKYLILLGATLLLFSSTEQKTKLNGVYKLEYTNTFYVENSTIIFEDSIYYFKNLRPFNVRGHISYGKTLTLLDVVNTYPNLVITFRTDDIEKDTIDFQVHDRNSQVMNYLDHSVNSGKLIKIE